MNYIEKSKSLQIKKISGILKKMRYFLYFLISVALGIGLFLFFGATKNIELKQPAEILSGVFDFEAESSTNPPMLASQNSDIENQKPLAQSLPAGRQAPSEIKGIYATSWSASSNRKIDELINFIKKNNLNAIVIDVKDFSGYVAYDIKNPEVEKYAAKEIRIPKINSLIKKLHDENIYVIARITIFQDPILANARPDLAIHSKNKCQLSNVNCQMSSSTLWFDHKGLAWIDPAAKEAWNYNIAIAKDAANRGFDEINFDYIRFASDGDLNDMIFPFWDGKTLKSHTIKLFFKYLHEQLAAVKISADLFGLATVNNDDLGIGQKIENAYAYFDYVCPMVYPSHYAKGFLGYKNPAQYPYEVIKYSMDSALKKLNNYEISVHGSSSIVYSSKLRPWIQDFDLGADYDAAMVKKEIQAVYDSVSSTPAALNGWMLWDPKNIYTRGALEE